MMMHTHTFLVRAVKLLSTAMTAAAPMQRS